MAGRPVYSDEQVNDRLQATLTLLDGVDPPEYLADLVAATFWNATGVAGHLLSHDEILEDVRKTLLLVSECGHSDAVRRTLYSALLTVVTPREHVGLHLPPGNAKPHVLQ